MKRIATVQDISCLGKCSLTVALPVVSAMGVECSVVPTAVLSTHTMFSGAYIRDLTEDIPHILSHWEEEEFRFDAVYTGYLASREQMALVQDMFHRFRREDNLMIVDPVMGDHGRLYQGFDGEFARQMAALCGVADIIVPNLTEACFMLGLDYPRDGYTRDDIRMLMKKLTALGARCAILTGVSFEKESIGVMGYDRLSGEFFEYFTQRVDASYHGTGDLFTATLVGGIVRGLPMERAMAVAADFVRQCLVVTKEHPTAAAYGVRFESAIGWLCRRMEEEMK